MNNPNCVYEDGCKSCGRVPTIIKLHEEITITPSISADSFGPFMADSYFCNECFTRILGELITRIE